ncbi:MAG TPA: alpha/beta hydrolase [Ideonella sp.]|uniref:alpha/beta hydrolase n=1 Tax=Ideonella sp. TaxID=1929293 RepID=UPI002E2FF789|nr:alpha/beta hydrolase [Ideonella sp.]HEX5687961.1 alpha/beta hydrolase [Ideonella sp.]
MQLTQHLRLCSSFRFLFGVAATFAAAAGPAAPAYAAAPVASSGKIVQASITLSGRSYQSYWYLPTAEPIGFIVVQHGFSRQCANLRTTTTRFMDQGFMALCINADMSGGNPALAEALGNAIVAGLVAPDGRPVPQPIVVSGHSAGGHFASRLGWTLAQSAPSRLKGSVMFDPVAADGSFTTNLQAISSAGKRSVLAVTANSGPCNSSNNAYPALRQVQADARANGRDDFVGVQLTSGSTHVDSEGKNTNLLGWIACLQGQPQVANSTRLRDLTSNWATDLVTGKHTATYYPGGSYLNGLVSTSVAKVID